MTYIFQFDRRLGIHLPILDKYWEDYSLKEQAEILAAWEAHRSDIPGRVKELEQIIMKKQEELNDEESFERSCDLNSEIAALASTINDLNIWFRIQQDTAERMHQ